MCSIAPLVSFINASNTMFFFPRNHSASWKICSVIVNLVYCSYKTLSLSSNQFILCSYSSFLGILCAVSSLCSHTLYTKSRTYFVSIESQSLFLFGSLFIIILQLCSWFCKKIMTEFLPSYNHLGLIIYDWAQLCGEKICGVVINCC